MSGDRKRAIVVLSDLRLTPMCRSALLGITFTLHTSGRCDVYDMDAKLPAHLAAATVGVSRQLVNYWRRSGKLTPVDQDGRHPLYRLGDVLRAEASTRRSPKSRRRAMA